MPSYRLQRINGILQRDLNFLIDSEIKDEIIREADVEVTSVRASSDLGDATVFVSISGDEANKKKVIKALEKAAGFLRKEVSSELQTHQTPALHFKIDNSEEYGAKIDGILEKLRAEGQISDSLPEEEDEAF